MKRLSKDGLELTTFKDVKEAWLIYYHLPEPELLNGIACIRKIKAFSYYALIRDKFLLEREMITQQDFDNTWARSKVYPMASIKQQEMN